MVKGLKLISTFHSLEPILQIVLVSLGFCTGRSTFVNRNSRTETGIFLKVLDLECFRTVSFPLLADLS